MSSDEELWKENDQKCGWPKPWFPCQNVPCQKETQKAKGDLYIRLLGPCW
jgi:hypothetical protein